MPKVSIIIPVYGVEKYLRQCLDSVISQTLKDIEVILVDDGGKDSCPQIIDEYAAKDERIVVVHKPNGGYGHSCNRGLDIANGEYIGIVEPDDFIDFRMYENLYKLASENDADIVKSSFYKYLDTTEVQEFDKVNWSKENELPSSVFTIKDCPLFLYFHPSIWSCIYKREFLNNNKIRFVEAPGAGWTDNPFQVQTMCLAKRILYTDKPYYYWRCVNLNQSEDLKDYTLPFNRSDEIHEWLSANNITDKNILEALYRREIAYIQIVLLKKIIADKEDCYNRVKAMCRRMDPEIVYNSVNISKRDKMLFEKCCVNPATAQLILKFRNCRRKFLMVHWNNDEKFIKILGKTLVRR